MPSSENVSVPIRKLNVLYNFLMEPWDLLCSFHKLANISNSFQKSYSTSLAQGQ